MGDADGHLLNGPGHQGSQLAGKRHGALRRQRGSTPRSPRQQPTKGNKMAQPICGTCSATGHGVQFPMMPKTSGAKFGTICVGCDANQPRSTK
jgi:hypothetical protein